jgi:hypothetical protein
MEIKENALTFDFPDGFLVQKLDDTTFYRKHFNGLVSGEKSQDKKLGVKSVDFVVFHPQQDELWLLEVKDYRANQRLKSIGVFDELAQKIISSLACLVAMQANANTEQDKDFAQKALQKIRLRIVLHLEQPSKPNKNHPVVLDPKIALETIRRRLRAVDSKALVSSIGILGAVPWTVK